MSTHPLKLILCIALGVWLGCVAVAVTGMFAYKSLIASEIGAVAAVSSVSSVSAAVNQLKLHAPHKAAPASSQPNPPSQSTQPSQYSVQPQSSSGQEDDSDQSSDNPMFEKYKQNLIDTQARQDDEEAKLARDKRISGPKCQFWLQQDQTAPSEKTHANVNMFCG